LGIVVNRVLGTGPAAQVLELFGLRDDGAEGELRVYAGGPVQPSSGLVLHSPDYVGEGTTVVNEDFALTSDAEVVRAIARGEGPRNSLIAFGYAGWGPGQLDDEIAQEAWVDVPADEAIVFDDDLESKWRRAFALRSVDL
jgi:putative transcriptional regulator